MATEVEKLLVRLEATQAKFEKQLASASNTADRRARQIERRFQTMNRNLDGMFARTFRGLTAPLTGLGAALGTREIARYADEWTEAGNKIRAAAQSAGVNARSLDLLKEGANEARTELSAYVDLYARLIRSASGVAKSEEEIAQATNVVAKAFKAGGASAQEQASGILQLGQALGSGVLQGDELRSLRENAPILAQAIADEFKTTIAGLKQLGADGALTSDRVFRAIINAQKPIEQQFKATNATIRDAITQVNNEFIAYIGNADESAGASRMLVDALQNLAENFTEVADVVVQFATILAGAFAGRAIAAAVGGIGNAVIALGTFVSALKAGRVAAMSFTAALGPIGLLAGGAAAALLLLNNRADDAASSAAHFRKAVDENKVALEAATGATYGQVTALKQLIAAQAQAARAAATQADADFSIALGRRDAFRKATGFEFAPLEYASEEAMRRANALDFAAAELERQLAEADKLVTSTPSSFGGGAEGGQGSGSSSGGRSGSDILQRTIDQIRERTSLIQAETAAQASLNPLIDDYGYAVEKARIEQDLLNAAKEQGVAITPALRAQIDQLSHNYAAATVEAVKLAEAHDEIRAEAEDLANFNKDLARGIIDGFTEGADAADIFADALKKVGDRLINDVLDGIFQVKNAAGGGGGGGLFGFLGSLFGGGGSPLASSFIAGGGVGLFAKGGIAAHGKARPLPTFARGGISKSAAIFGEAGPEAAVPLPDGRRIPVDLRMPSTKASAAAPSREVAININLAGARGDAEIRRMVVASVHEGISEFSRTELPLRVNEISEDPRAVG